ncbi:hypothetical protein V1512DRAFT_264585 [Lipomyces arxii]|uniref:uncharacterized protein n=1 Tax=Lipomyces arxii TaxID=56418 RepID=UPI0034CDAF4E
MQSTIFEVIILPPPSSVLTLSRTIAVGEIHTLLLPYLARRHNPSDTYPAQTHDLSAYLELTFGIQAYVFPGVKISSENGELTDIAISKTASLEPPSPCTLEFISENVAINGKVYVCPIGQKEEKKWHGIARAAAMDKIMGVKRVKGNNSTDTKFLVCIQSNRAGALHRQVDMQNFKSFAASPLPASSLVVPKQRTKQVTKPKKKRKELPTERQSPPPKRRFQQPASTPTKPENNMFSPQSSSVRRQQSIPFTTPSVSTNDEARCALASTPPSYISLTTDLVNTSMWKGYAIRRIGHARFSPDELLGTDFVRVEQELPIEKLNMNPSRKCTPESPVKGLRAAYFNDRPKLRQWDGLFTASEINKKLNTPESYDKQSEWIVTSTSKTSEFSCQRPKISDNLATDSITESSSYQFDNSAEIRKSQHAMDQAVFA